MRAQRILAGLHVCTAMLLVALLAFPIRSGLIRLLILVSAMGLIFGSGVWFRRWWAKCLLPGIAAICFLAVAFFPSRPVDLLQLRTEYVQSLRRYEGTRYVWGGENRSGIDCSGLLRAAWVDSRFRLGIQTANAHLIRGAFLAWFNDSSAQNLSVGARGETRLLHSGKSVRANADRGLMPGDFAIVADGVHALAFLGDQKWIEADPAIGKVIVLQSNDNSPWLDSSAIFMRWRKLE